MPITNPPQPASRLAPRHLDLRLAESYVPAVVLWFKCMLYASIVPAYFYSGSMHVAAVGGFLVALYYDHVYMDPYPNVVGSTTIAIDVVAGCIVELLLDMETCWLCMFVSGAWFACGCAHIVWSHAGDAVVVPLPVMHLTSAFLLIAQLVCASPSRHDPRQEVTEMIGCFVRAAVYAILTVADVYLLRSAPLCFDCWMLLCVRVCLLSSDVMYSWRARCVVQVRCAFRSRIRCIYCDTATSCSHDWIWDVALAR